MSAERLNPAQREAVRATEGPVRVIAGPGTGKTRTLTQRYCYLVSVLGIAPKNILCATFTNRAAEEMKRRVRAESGDLEAGHIGTFHAFCARFLKDTIHLLHWPKNFIILDTEDQKQLLLKIFDEMGLTLRDMTVRRALDEILEAKKLHAASYIDDILLLDNERLKDRFTSAGDRDEEIFLRYLYEQKKCFGCDFNDLINFACHILEKFDDVRRTWQERMQYVMIDEFQDVSARQYTIGRLLSGLHGNLFIVGDPDQTIYSWRGSHSRLFLDFDKRHPGTKTVVLEENYRSTPPILAAAQALIAKNAARYPHALRAVRGGGQKPVYRHALSEKREAELIAAEILRLREGGTKLRDCAVLYRAHYLTRALEERFIAAGLPYKMFSGVEFYGRREIKDVICYLRMVTVGDDAALLRTINTPPRKMGKKRLEELAAHARLRGLSLYDALKELHAAGRLKGTRAGRYIEAVETARALGGISPAETLQRLLDLSGYEEFLRLQGDQERLDNVAELKRAVELAGRQDEAGLEDFLAGAALFTDPERLDAGDAVRLMTIHAAKGTEFAHVFVCGLNEGVLPGRRAATPDELEEERRLAYVAITRARESLHLSDAEGATNDGLFKYPSRFLIDIGPERLDCSEADRILIERGFTPAPPPVPPLSRRSEAAFATGDRVLHPVFGPGLITAVRPEEGCYAVRFDSLPTERSIRLGMQMEKI